MDNSFKVETTLFDLRVFDKQNQEIATLPRYNQWIKPFAAILGLAVDVNIGGKIYTVDKEQYRNYLNGHTSKRVTDQNITKYVNFADVQKQINGWRKKTSPIALTDGFDQNGRKILKVTSLKGASGIKELGTLHTHGTITALVRKLFGRSIEVVMGDKIYHVNPKEYQALLEKGMNRKIGSEEIMKFVDLDQVNFTSSV